MSLLYLVCLKIKYPVEVPTWVGYLMWRKQINDLGGICIGGDSTRNIYNECTSGVRKRVCLVMIDVFDEVFFIYYSIIFIVYCLLFNQALNEANYQRIMREWVDEIAERDIEKRPHFIFTPMGDNYNTMRINIIKENFFFFFFLFFYFLLVAEYIYDKYGDFGFNTFLIGSCAPTAAFGDKYKYMFTPLMKTDESATSAIEFFEKRLNFHKWVILSDTHTIDYSIQSVNALVTKFKNIMKHPINLMLKRCTSQV